MTVWKPLSRAAGLGLCVVAFTGSALADPGNGNGNGPAVAPPGQEKKAEAAPAAPAPVQPQNAGQEKKAETPAVNPPAKGAAKPAAKAAKPAAKAKPAKPAKASPAKAAKPAEKTKPQPAAKAAKPAPAGGYKASSSGTDLKKGLAHKHTICHATGSASNPYVRITPSISGVHNGHVGHQDGDDIVPPYTYKGVEYSQNWDTEGQAIFAAGCVAPAATTRSQASPERTKSEKDGCPAATTERVVVGVWHATGAVKDGERKYVFITPNAGSAHFDTSKHPDDRRVYETRTVTTAGERCEEAAVRTSATTPPTSGQGQPQALGTSPGAPASSSAPVTAGAGGVLGAVSPAHASSKAEPADRGGVLGAITSAPGSLAETATTATLPFTGMPLWVATLFGALLLAAGIALRRSV